MPQTQPVNNSVDNSNIASPVATSANQQLNVNESPTDTQITAKQRDLINRLKQNSNRLQNSLAAETAKNALAPATISTAPSSVNALATKQRDLINRLKQNSNRLQNSLAAETAKNALAPATISTNPSSVNALATKQKDLINRLKQNSNSLQNSLAAETAKNALAPATISTNPSSVNALATKQRDLINRLKQNSLALTNKSVQPSSAVEAQSNNQASVGSLAAEANFRQSGNSPEVTTSKPEAATEVISR